MEPRNGEEQPRATLEKIELDLATYKVHLHFKDHKEPLVLHFDTPARRFYFALIALVITEMKHLGKPEFIHIRKHEKTLKLLDHSLAGPHASETESGMWDKIRKAWHYRLSDLEEAIHFKILDRDRIAPYEKGGKYRYECSEEESDAWANLFAYDEHHKWRFKFAIDSASLDLDDIHLTLGDSKDSDAWNAFIDHLRKTQEPSIPKTEEKQKTILVSLYRPALIIIVALMVSGAAAWYIIDRSISGKTQSEISAPPSIVILPFANVGNDPDKEYFCDGITEELINNLARLKCLRVISRTSAFYFKDKNLDIRTIGEKLNVEHVLEGSVQVSGDKLRITAQLVNIADDSHLWADSYDRDMRDVFDLQDNLAKEIVCNLKTRLGCKDRDYVKSYTENVEAFQLYKKGRYFSVRWELKKAIEYFKQAIELDPNYALAYTGLTDAYKMLAFYYFQPNTPYHTYAMEAALKALEIDDELPEAHYQMAKLKLDFEWDWKSVERGIKRVIELNPGAASSHVLYEDYLRAMGRFDEGIEEIKIALRLDPMSALVNNRYGVALLVDRQVKQAIKQLQATLDIHPYDLEAMIYLGNAYLDIGKHEECIVMMKKALDFTQGGYAFVMGIAGNAYGKIGMKAKAQEILNEALERSKESYFSSFAIALIYMGLGNTDKTFEWLEKAYEEHNPGLTWIKAYPQFLSLHSEPRWTALLKKMGLEG
jgi:adenylate cyclase